MNVSGLRSLTNTKATFQVGGQQATGQSLTPPVFGGTDFAASQAASTDISKVGQFYSKLQQLQQQDPTKFEQVVTNIANQLQTAAQQQGQTPAGRFLFNLASKVEIAANGGNLSQLTPSNQLQRSGSQYQQRAAGAAYSQTVALHAAAVSAVGHSQIGQLFSNIVNQVDQALSPASKP